MFYQQNNDLLSDVISSQLEHIKNDSRLTVYDCKQGSEKTIAVSINSTQKVFLHSSYNPQKEANAFISSIDIKGYQKIILVGFALGYHVEQLLSELQEHQKLVVIIINPDIFKKALQIRDLKRILSDKRLTIIFGQNEVTTIKSLEIYMKQHGNIRPKFIIHPPSLKTISQDFQQLKNILETIDTHTRSSLQYNSLFKDNFANSINYIMADQGVNAFINVFKNKPIFIVSAGPSLNKNINELKKIVDKGIIIAQGTSLNTLINHGIEPDFITVIHGEENVYLKQMKDHLHLHIPLLYIPGVNYHLLQKYSGKRIIGLPKRDYYPKLEMILKKGYIKSGGSVATVALDFARQLGGNPLVFVGQDLAISASGDKYSDGIVEKEHIDNPAQLLKVMGIDGQEVYTLKNYHIFLKWFEHYIADYPLTTFINATEGGANITGTSVQSLHEVISTYCTDTIEKAIIDHIISAPDKIYYEDELKQIRLLTDTILNSP